MNNTQLLIDYANKNIIILELNEKDQDRNNQLLIVTIKNNIEMIQLLMNYMFKFNNNKYYIEFERAYDEFNPLLTAININNVEII